MVSNGKKDSQTNFLGPYELNNTYYGALVLDPFMGSGTVAKMAVEAGRRYLGFDFSQKYVDLAQRRVQNARKPLGILE